MPYIKDDRRVALYNPNIVPQTAGELNYKITLEILRYLSTRGENYATINDILGALDGASKEFYRRVAAPYEDEKINKNGDVY